MSLPSRERGLKFFLDLPNLIYSIVAPLAGAWIEICHYTAYTKIQPSLPSRERGLK